MKVMMISMDRAAFKENAAVRRRFAEYGSLCESLHIIVFAKKGYRTEAIAPNVFLHPTDSSSRWGYIPDAIRIGKTLPRPDLVTSSDPSETGLAAWFIARAHGANLQVQIHTDFLSPYFARHSFLNRLRVMLARFLLPKADGIRAVSERIKKSLQTVGYKLKVSPVVLPMFIDAEKLMSAVPAFDLHVRYPRFNFIVLTVARLEPEKNLSLALRAMARVVKEYPNAGYVIVGEGGERTRLETEAKRLSIEKNVAFAGWQEDTASFYRGADLYLSTSDYEGYGLSLVEAAVHGTPVVATHAGVASDLFKEGESALVCAPKDEACIVQKIKTALLDVELRHRLKRAARAGALRMLPANKMVYLSEYKKAWEAAAGAFPRP